MNVFISQPIRGRKSDEIQAERLEIFKKYKKDHESAVLLDSLVKPEIKSMAERSSDIRKPRVWCLGEALHKLAEADIVIMAPGWEGYPGCRIEQKVATYYDIPIEYAR